MSNELIKIPDGAAPKFTPKVALSGLAAKKIAAQTALSNAGAQEIKPKTPEEMEHRIGIVFDDSGSMDGIKLTNAKLGVEEFLRSCSKDNTAVCIYPMNREGIKLTINLPAVAIYSNGNRAGGGTPLLQTLGKMKNENPSLTRAIVFSDGQPDNNNFSHYNINKDWGLIVDTVFIGSSGEEFMCQLAELTGGIFLKFDPSKSNFAAAFKYLSPGLRYLLTDKAFVSKLEGK